MENSKTELSKSTGSRTSKQPETSTILQSERVEVQVNPMQEVELGLVHSGLEITKIVQTKSDTGEVLDMELTKLEVEELVPNISQHQSPSNVISLIHSPPFNN